jgi:DNA gyrase subunit A
VFEIPLAARNAKGRAIVNLVSLEANEKITAIVEIPKIEPGKFVVTVTKGGQIKKTELTEYENFREKGIIGVKIEEGDQLLSAVLTDGSREFLIATKQGQSIRFPEEQVRPMGRATVGVKAVDLAEGDQVVGIEVSNPERPHVLAVCERGFGKRTHIDEFRLQNRGGKGIILIDASDRNGPVVDIRLVNDKDECMLITDRGQTLRTRVGEIRETGRNAQGVKLMTLGDGERVVAMERLAESEVDTGSEMPPEGSVEGEPQAEGSAADVAPDAGSLPPGELN